MSQPIAAWRVTYTPGNWVALAGPTSLAILQPAPARVSGLLNRFWDDILATTSIQELSAQLAAHNLSQLASFALLFWDEAGLHAITRGSVRIHDADTGAQLATGEGVVTWTETALGRDGSIRIDLEPVDPSSVLQLPLVVGGACVSSLHLTTDPAALVHSSQGGALAADAASRAAEPEPESVADAAAGIPLVVPVPGAIGPLPPLVIPAAAAGFDGDEAPSKDVADPGSGLEPLAEDAEADAELEAYEPEVMEAEPEPVGPDLEVEPEHEPELQPESAIIDSIPDVGAPVQETDPASEIVEAEVPEVAVVPDDLLDHAPEPIAPVVVEEAAVAPMPISAMDAPAEPVILDHQSVEQPVEVAARDDATGLIIEPAAEPQHDNQPEPAVSVPPIVVPPPPVALDAAQPTPEGGLVSAVVCQLGHPNPPGAQYCRICQAPAGTIARLVPRPTLAVVRSSFGVTLDLSSAIVVGRAPDTQGDTSVQVLKVPSPNTDISRSHLRVQTNGWQVEVIDLNSTNGSILAVPGRQPFRMQPGAATAVPLGSIVDLGDGIQLRIDPPR